MPSTDSWMVTDAEGKQCCVQVPPDNLINLSRIHEPAITQCLQERFKKNKIYTSAGYVLLVMNPCKYLPELYSEEVMEKYRERGESDRSGNDKYGSDPHIFATADSVYRIMMRMIEDTNRIWLRRSFRRPFTKMEADVANQVIFVSGETGGGKSTTVKHLVTYLANLSHYKKYSEYIPIVSLNSYLYNQGLPGIDKNREISLEEKVLASIRILQSFGNARKGNNDDSSCHGSFVRLNFDKNGCLAGGRLNTYLLDTFRLYSHAQDERNFHIFYELLEGADRKFKEKLFLNVLFTLDFRMLSESSTFERRDGCDEKSFHILVHVLRVVGFTD